MARPLRTNFDGAWHHVMNRGAGKRAIFHERGDRERFLEILGEASETYGLEVHAYCLMDNHYHLLVRTFGSDLGQPMRSIGGIYTQWYNSKYGTDGPLFRGRYKSLVVADGSYLLAASRYIHLNPVEAGAAKKPGAYDWSSYNAYIGKKKAPEWLHTGPTLQEAGGANQGRTRYQALVEGSEGEDPKFDWPPEGAEGAGDKAEGARRAGKPSLAQINKAVASLKVGGVSGMPLVNQRRMAAVWIARRRFGYEVDTLVEAYDFGTPGSLSASLSRFGRRMAEDKVLKSAIDGCLETLVAWEPGS